MNGCATRLVLDFGGVVTRSLFETQRLTEQRLGRLGLLQRRRRGAHRIRKRSSASIARP